MIAARVRVLNAPLMMRFTGWFALLGSVFLISACGSSSDGAHDSPAGGGTSSAGSGGSSGNGGVAGAAHGGSGGSAGSNSSGNSSCVKTTCTASSPSTTLTGTTPNGALSLSYAWKKQVSGFTNSTTLTLTNSSTASVSQCDEPSLSVQLDPTAGVGAQTAIAFVLYQDGTETDVSTTVTIDADDEQGITSGKIDVTASGWDLHGTFQAPDCPALDFVDK